MLTFLSLACCLAARSLQKDECSLLHCKGKGQVSEFLKISHGYTYTWSLFCRVVFLYFLPPYGNYSDLEAPTLKMGFVCLLLLLLFLLLLFFGGGATSGVFVWCSLLVGKVQLGRWHGSSDEEQNVGNWNFACLTWLYRLFVRMLISVANTCRLR